jgi:drug/metabolite transporter (DMT)-like permease
MLESVYYFLHHIRQNMQRTQREGVLLIILAITGYSCLPVITKNLFAQGVDPLDVAFWRFFLTALVYWGFVLVRVVLRRNRTTISDVQVSSKPLPRLRLVLLGTFFVGEALAAFWGLERLPSATFVVLFYSYPAIVAILGLFFGERISSLAWFALAMTLVGIALTAPDFSAGLTGDNFVGVLMALIDALLVAVYFLLIGRLIRGEADMIMTSVWTVTGAALLMIVVALVRGLTLPQGDSWLYLGLLALVSTVMPVFALNAGIVKLGATRAAILCTFEPVLTAVLAYVFLQELMLPIQWLGGAIIIASVILLQLRRPASASSEQTA